MTVPIDPGSIPNDWATQKRALFAVTVVFVLLNLVLILTAVSPDTLVEADSLTFQRMAEEFLATGAFTEEGRQPLYPLVMAAAIRVAGDGGLSVLVALQIAMLFATGLVARAIALPWLGSAATVVFGLVVLNPNAIGLAHWPLADTLHAFLFTVSIWALLSFGLRGGLRWAVACGSVLGLAAMTRPESALLIFLLPIAIPLVSWLAKKPTSLVRGILCGFTALAIANVVSLPWMLHNAAAGNGMAMTGGAKSSDSARGHFAIAEAERTASTRLAVLQAAWDAEPEVLALAGLADENLTEQRQYLIRYYLGRTLDVGPVVLARLYSKAWVAQFASGGAQSINLLFGLKLERGDKFLNEPGAVGAFFVGLKGQPVASAITLGAVGFAVVARILGLIGVLVVAAGRHWPLLVVIVAVFAFKGFVHMFYGLARYRLPVEPLLMILTVYGWQGLRALRPGRV
jgi:4-amino-4-deoxy-L-arabinose transferase-like glycosyltransferase